MRDHKPPPNSAETPSGFALSARQAGIAFVLKADIRDTSATVFEFIDQKTMYGGKHIAAGDLVFLIASETQGGSGLVAKGVVRSAETIARRPGIERQTPCVSFVVASIERATRRLGRAEIKPFTDWDDGKPQTELNFKLYRQATNKIVGVTPATAAFLQSHF